MRLNDERSGTVEASVASALSKMSKERLAGAKAVLKAIAVALEAQASSDDA
jgi:hypothetical protein